MSLRLFASNPLPPYIFLKNGMNSNEKSENIRKSRATQAFIQGPTSASEGHPCQRLATLLDLDSRTISCEGTVIHNTSLNSLTYVLNEGRPSVKTLWKIHKFHEALRDVSVSVHKSHVQKCPKNKSKIVFLASQFSQRDLIMSTDTSTAWQCYGTTLPIAQPNARDRMSDSGE